MAHPKLGQGRHRRKILVIGRDSNVIIFPACYLLWKDLSWSILLPFTAVFPHIPLYCLLLRISNLPLSEQISTKLWIKENRRISMTISTFLAYICACFKEGTGTMLTC